MQSYTGKPLPKLTRPEHLSDIVGQPAVENIARILASNSTASLLLYGPPGTGKSTTARIIANEQNLELIHINCTIEFSVTNLKKQVAAAHKNGLTALVYLDEIHYLNRKQQDVLLPLIEDGDIQLIGATSANPWHALDKALMSRLLPLEFKPVATKDISTHITNVTKQLDIDIEPDTVEKIAAYCSGDMREAMKTLDMLARINEYDHAHPLNTAQLEALVPDTRPHGATDINADEHYKLASALQKSIRGSDPDAAVFYLMRLIDDGDIITPIRRLQVIACEDIGLADPMAIVETRACVEAAEALGLPEATKPLIQATVYLATSLKSYTNEAMSNAAMEDIKAGKGMIIPKHIAAEHAREYVWPQDKPRHWVDQQYLPNDLINAHYYMAGDSPIERKRAAQLNAMRNIVSPEQRTDHPSGRY